MSVRFVAGRVGTGKTTYCLNEINDKLIENPLGDPIIYITPDQMTFLSEYKLVSGPEIKSAIRAQVYSFSRLAWLVLQETGGANRIHLNNIGLNMLVRKIIEENRSDLKIFKLVSNKTGFTTEVEQMLTEFRRYCIEPGELLATEGQLDETNEGLANKLHDLQLIYNKFEQVLHSKYIDSEDFLQLLADNIEKSAVIKKAEIYIDGFYDFTPQEYEVVKQLMKHCPRVTIVLTTDQINDGITNEDLDLFRLTKETAATLMTIAHNEKVAIEESMLLETQYRWNCDSLKHLEKNFSVQPVNTFNDKTSVTICEAANRRAEMEGISREIISLVRDFNYEYRHLAILLRNGEDYNDLLENVFNAHKIPFFIDEKQKMLNHPLVELIRSTLEIITNNWRYESVFRAVKTELLFPYKSNIEVVREQMDQLENYVLSRGIQGERWANSEKWPYRKVQSFENINKVQTDHEKHKEDKLNEARNYIVEPIAQLSKKFKKAKNGRDLCSALFEYIEQLRVKEKLEQWQDIAQESGLLVESSEHAQVWEKVINLLDQFVEVLGDEKISLKNFRKIVDTGLESLTFNALPPALDQVIVANLDNSRLDNVKVCFVIGLNEGVLPAKLNESGLLADNEREKLTELGIQLAPNSKTRLLDEQFVAYRTFSLPAEKLFLTYPIANEEGKGLLPSYYIKRMEDMFPNINRKEYSTDTAEQLSDEQLSYVVNKEVTLSYLMNRLERYKRTYPINELWWDTYNYYLNDEKFEQIIKRLLSSLFYDNKAEQLDEIITKSLYGDEILASVSRMELYHRCPFSHFAQYGLRLQERKVFKLELPQIGELFHDALNYVGEKILKEDISLDSLTTEKIKKMAAAAVDEIAPNLQNKILFSTNRHTYMQKKLKKIVSQASIMLVEQARQSSFAPVGLEIGFGPNEKLPALELSLKNNTSMQLRGRIDRIDKASTDDNVYVRIIDYKSSSKKLNLTEVYYGLSLQMLTYLDVVTTHATKLINQEALPGGVLYFHVHNPFVDGEKDLTDEELLSKMLRNFKMEGLLLAESEAVKLMDNNLKTGRSSIVPAGIKKDESFYADSSVATLEQFSDVTRYIRKLYVNSGNEIISGSNEIAPFKMGDRTACTYCSFKDVCQFDESLPNNDYRKMYKKDNEEFFKLIAEEVNGNE